MIKSKYIKISIIFLLSVILIILAIYLTIQNIHLKKTVNERQYYKHKKNLNLGYELLKKNINPALSETVASYLSDTSSILSLNSFLEKNHSVLKREIPEEENQQEMQKYYSKRLNAIEELIAKCPYSDKCFFILTEWGYKFLLESKTLEELEKGIFNLTDKDKLLQQKILITELSILDAYCIYKCYFEDSPHLYLFDEREPTFKTINQYNEKRDIELINLLKETKNTKYEPLADFLVCLKYTIEYFEIVNDTKINGKTKIDLIVNDLQNTMIKKYKNTRLELWQYFLESERMGRKWIDGHKQIESLNTIVEKSKPDKYQEGRGEGLRINSMKILASLYSAEYSMIKNKEESARITARIIEDYYFLNNPEKAELHCQLSYYYRELGKYKEALSISEKALFIDPNSKRAKSQIEDLKKILSGE